MGSPFQIQSPINLPALAAALIACASMPSYAAEGYIVTRDEQEYFGIIDSRTDDANLWLSTKGSTFTIRRAIPWADITATELNGVRAAVADFKLAAITAADVARQEAVERGESHRLVEPDGTIRLAIRGRAPHQTFPVDPPPAPPRITSLQIDAFLANWDADVEPDGLIVRMTLVDRSGQAIAADTTLDLDLWATRQYSFSEKPFSGGQSVEPISRWSKFVRAGDFDANGTAEVRLPFQQIDPEVMRSISRYGLAHARAAVAGHGVFDASIDGVRLRAFTPTRDQLQRFGQDRFLPTEQRGLYRP